MVKENKALEDFNKFMEGYLNVEILTKDDIECAFDVFNAGAAFGESQARKAFKIEIDSNIPKSEIHFKDKDGKVLSKIVNIGEKG